MREITSKLEKELRDLAHKKFESEGTYMFYIKNRPNTANALKARYADFIVDRYKSYPERKLKEFYKTFKLNNGN